MSKIINATKMPNASTRLHLTVAIVVFVVVAMLYMAVAAMVTSLLGKLLVAAVTLILLAKLPAAVAGKVAPLSIKSRL